MISYLILGLVAELIFRNLLARQKFQHLWRSEASYRLPPGEKIAAGLLRELPSLLGLLVFAAVAYFSYFASGWSESAFLRLVFFALLLAITLTRLALMLFRMFFSPASPSFRLLPIDCQVARRLYLLSVAASTYFIFSFLLVIVIRKLGGQPETIDLLQLMFATVLLSTAALLILVSRNRVRDQILVAGGQEGEAGWSRRHFASIWFLPALAYLGILWLLVLVDLVDSESVHGGAFLLSFFALPLWLVLDRVVVWIVGYTLVVLRFQEERKEPEGVVADDATQITTKVDRTRPKVLLIARIILAASLLLWIASLWNIHVPFFSVLSSVIFDAMVIVGLALLVWTFVSGLIEQKLQESMPQEEEENNDDEWGGTAARGRAFTLLPLLRRFLGTILITVVTLTVLSAMGVDIGPLLAGAGVVGLAVGFGAQKLVSDMFSGFFYLLDDAFRVGEYIEAGTISGTVEGISLRNVLLRHHRGMLQIVPHSELGAVTNFMRGGIVVKFNLDFPYDADIDQIRKVIKKVGQAMLEDEELGKDFLKPMKSQGVREITNSVMTIRVKFTARPGAHFVIRREAYRRITEALRAKAIHYAHRKVIVDLPKEMQQQGAAGSPDESLFGVAGAAAARALEEEGNLDEGGKRKDTGAGS